MNDPIYVEVIGKTKGSKTVPVEGTVKVGDVMSIFVGPEKDERELIVMLRCVIAAMRMSNEIGLSKIDIDQVVNGLLDDRLHDARSIRAALHAIRLHEPKPEDWGFPVYSAWFATPDRSGGTNTRLDQGEQTSGRTCSLADLSRQADRGDE